MKKFLLNKFSKHHLLFRAKIGDFANKFLVAQPSCWDLAKSSFRSENHEFGLCSYVHSTGRMRPIRVFCATQFRFWL